MGKKGVSAKSESVENSGGSVPAKTSSCDGVETNAIWRHRVSREIRDAQKWEENWGGLTPMFADLHRGADARQSNVESAAATTLGNDPILKEQRRPSGVDESQKSDDKTAKEDDQENLPMWWRYRQSQQRLPKDKYTVPQTTNQTIGWRNNLELFGVSHHGRKTNKEINSGT
eukprot:GHVT01065551.1.p1 GENE.GHVT01065551.1~~GHVT01065551.1.p1  ORF type:complete len:172 (-),score=31.17 GHVT01065551.1:1456-1971(-)